MFAGTSFQRVWRLRFLKFSQLEVQSKSRPVAPLNTKSTDAKKPVRYTSIKKAKPKTIADIARILQQKTKETKEGKPAKPAATNQYDAMVESTETILPSVKAQTGSSTPPAKGAEEGLSVASALVDKEPAQDILDLRAVAKHAPKNAFRPAASTFVDAAQMNSVEDVDHLPQETHVAESRTFTETTPAPTEAPETASVASPMDGRYSKDVDQTSMAMKHLPKVTFVEILNPKDAEPLAVVFDSPPALNISASLTAGPETVTKIGDAQASKNLTDPIQVQNEVLEDVSSPSHSIATSEAAPVVFSEVPTFPEVSAEEFIAPLNATPETASVSDHLSVVSSPEPVEEPAVVTSISASVNETEQIVSVEDGTMTGDASSSINLKDPVLVHAELEEPVAPVDPIQRLFLEKIREYSTKSKSSSGLVDAGPEYEKALKEELAKLQRLYGGGDLTEFPEFKFSECNLEEDLSKR